MKRRSLLKALFAAPAGIVLAKHVHETPEVHNVVNMSPMVSSGELMHTRLPPRFYEPDVPISWGPDR